MEPVIQNQPTRCPVCNGELNSFTVDFQQSTVFMCINYKCSYPFEQHTLGVYFKPSKVKQKKGPRKRRGKKTKIVRGTCSSSSINMDTSVTFPDTSLVVESPHLQIPETSNISPIANNLFDYNSVTSLSPTDIGKENPLGDISVVPLVNIDWLSDEINKLLSDEIPTVFPLNDQNTTEETLQTPH
ncbi:hypothetical protein PHYBLDRAFT_65470 [Phycomyces blakesleeanus NRRL 1555(-)]|uniref:Uncharacterized protein n=1 Tax=Phycomyces blakesleeanus (strain ATCC 8743b / DSM 1359 / FGSC 10004 / NBRC 33097 / NRRL 1555) TaxID=763407 RepID=A0A167MCU3_PHYB8|nr:hypothetical protein PHYBLDRAFT_65470 [Phycomyces blakesleeanus NRRL 1555(-)]OAD72487.1 hypothetical protein PHYBLDRAFT_65470 [Phycomyces blakesleeanus NRRL 1555(-)]|eukprot:XP_018290527.1 hypothetical protein PHYBLDRAFT_65470 [Phycomyces blakesleeanus NRRL 1555(-)]